VSNQALKGFEHLKHRLETDGSRWDFILAGVVTAIVPDGPA